jgi:hypothetical protein
LCRYSAVSDAVAEASKQKREVVMDLAGTGMLSVRESASSRDAEPVAAAGDSDYLAPQREGSGAGIIKAAASNANSVDNEYVGERRPRITPDMSYDAQQEEYARFARLESERNDRIATQAEEHNRKAIEEHAKRDRLAAENAANDAASLAMKPAAADEAVEQRREEEVARREEEEEKNEEGVHRGYSMAKQSEEKPRQHEAEAAAATTTAGEQLVVEVPDDVSEAAAVRRERVAPLAAASLVGLYTLNAVYP